MSSRRSEKLAIASILRQEELEAMNEIRRAMKEAREPRELITDPTALIIFYNAILRLGEENLGLLEKVKYMRMINEDAAQVILDFLKTQMTPNEIEDAQDRLRKAADDLLFDTTS